MERENLHYLIKRFGQSTEAYQEIYNSLSIQFNENADTEDLSYILKECITHMRHQLSRLHRDVSVSIAKQSLHCPPNINNDLDDGNFYYIKKLIDNMD